MHSQVDVVVPSHPGLAESLSKLQTSYHRGRFALCAVLDAAYHILDKYALQKFFALSLGSIETDDIWCLDHRGLLTLLLTKDTYQRLGLIGQKEEKRSDERYVVLVDLYERESKLFSHAKKAFERWDNYRESQGLGSWEVLYQESPIPLQGGVEVPVKTAMRHSGNIVVPSLDICPPEAPDEDAREDWQDKITEYFEWIGMVCMSSERLKANDRASPYIAVYEPPSPHEVADVSQFTWHGFLTPPFVEQIIATVLKATKVQPGEPYSKNPFVAITVNTYPDSPVTFISSSTFSEGVKPEARKKLPSKNVACWSLIVKESKDSDNWILANVGS